MATMPWRMRGPRIPADEFVKLRRKEDGVVFVRSENPACIFQTAIPLSSTTPHPDVVSRLERKAGRAKFDRSPWGVYLPVGYRRRRADRTGSWPSDDSPVQGQGQVHPNRGWNVPAR